jgi:dephospho-CoA kinase
MIIGLTGKSCAGKNHIAALLEARGIPVLDVDKLGYQVLETEKEAIFSKFGEDLRNDTGSEGGAGSLNRRLLGQRVFGNPEKLAELEAIVHPPANRLTEEWIAKNSADGRHCVINAALLHRSTAFNRLGCVILVEAPYLIRLLRAKRRDGLPFKTIIRRFASQKDFNSQYLSINAEIYKVENPGFLKLGNRIDKIIEGIK